MSHLIISGIDHVYTPAESEFAKTWHGLEELVGSFAKGEIARVLRPVVQTGIRPDIDCELNTLQLEDNEALAMLKDYKLIMADLREDGKGMVPLHVPKKGYCIHQNEALFDAFVAALDSVVGPNGYEIATVGTLGGYSQFFVSVSLKGHEGFRVGKSDVHKAFYNLISSHNGLVASADMLSFVRMVCMNTVQFSIQDAEVNGTRRTIRHSKNSESLITETVFGANLEGWLKSMERTAAFFNAAACVPMNADQFKAFAAGVFTTEGSDQLSTVSFNRIDSLETLFRKGKGNEGKTLGDAVNAFTEYFTHGDGVGKGSTQAKRIASANFGRGNDWKLEAIRIAGDETLLADTIKRGEILFTDKMKAVSLSN